MKYTTTNRPAFGVAKTKHVTLTLTAKEAALLYTHWRVNLSYGASGTFGDGDKITHNAKRGEIIARKIHAAITLSL